MKQLLAALRFLTIAPIPAGKEPDAASLRGGVYCFPIVGALIGMLAAAVAWSAALFFPPMVAASLTVIFLIAVSGGLHIDGLSDTADGFFSSRPRERILEIMRDSHIGAMGVVAIVSVLILKVSALSAISPDSLWRVAALMPLAGRTAIVISIWLLPYARQEGLASAFYATRSFPLALASTVVLLALSLFLMGAGGLIAAGASVATTLLFAVYCRRKIGGATGDTLGAACEIAELVPALILSAWQFYPLQNIGV